MMNKPAQILLLCSILAFLPGACQPENDKNPVLLGQWQGKSWLVMGKPSGQDASQVSFEFKADGTYTARYGTQGESGVWRTVEDKLYTTAGGQKEKVVMFSIAEFPAREQIQNAVSNGQTTEALAMLAEFNRYRNDITLLQSQYKDSEKAYKTGLIQYKEWQQNVSRINFAVLEILDTILAKPVTGHTANLKFDMNRAGQQETIELIRR